MAAPAPAKVDDWRHEPGLGGDTSLLEVADDAGSAQRLAWWVGLICIAGHAPRLVPAPAGSRKVPAEARDRYGSRPQPRLTTSGWGSGPIG